MSKQSVSKPKVWPVVLYQDCPNAITFLEEAFGFTTMMKVEDDKDPTVVVHAQLRGPDGGGVMVSSALAGGDNPFRVRPTGAASVYLVTSSPDSIYRRALAAGANLFAPIVDEDHGGRGFSVTDPENNVWSFGTYEGE